MSLFILSRFKDILRRIWAEFKGFLRDRNLLTFGLFIIFAAILWYGHAMNAVRERTLSISIVYTGVADNIAFEQNLPDAFRLTIRDQGKRLQKYREESFAPIEIDLSQQLLHKEGHIHITADHVRSKIADQLQGTAKIQKVQPEVIASDYYTLSKKTVPVTVTGTLTPATQYMFAGEAVATPASVTIYGKEAVLDSVKQVFTESVNETDIRDTLLRQVALQTPEGIRLSVDSVSLMVVAEQFTEKTFTLKIHTKGVPEGEKLRIFPSTAEATIRIALSHFNEVSESSIEAVCQYPREATATLPVALHYNNSNIIQARVNPAEVEYIIEKR